MIKQLYYLKTGKNLPVFTVDNVKDYCTRKTDLRKGINRVPGHEKRQAAEDIYN